MPKKAQFLPPAPIKNDLEGPQKWTPRESKVGPREGPIFGPLVFSKKVIVASAWLCDVSSYIPSMTTLAAQRVNCICIPGPCASVVISADMLRVRGCIILSYLNFFWKTRGPEIGPSARVPFWCQRGPNFCPPRQSKMIWRGPKNGPRENQKWALVRGPFLGPWFFQKR